MKNLKFKVKGETGIGTLIIFIALVLVAAIAAGVLLGTAGSLQQKALTTGKQTTQEVSSGIQVISLTATDGQDGTIETFELTIKLSSGSDPLALNDTIIAFDTKNSSQNLIYTGVANTSTYSATYVKTGPDYLPGYITIGDVIRIQFNSTYPIGQGSIVRTKVIPKRGVIVPVDFVTPDVISTQRVNLYP